MRERPLGVNVYGVSEHKGTAVAGGFFTIVTLCAVLSEARTTRIEITRVVPAFEGQMFGDVGPLRTGHWLRLRRGRSRPMVGPRMKIAFIRMPTSRFLPCRT